MFQVLITKDAANCDNPQKLVYTTKVLFGKDEVTYEQCTLVLVNHT